MAEAFAEDYVRRNRLSVHGGMTSYDNAVAKVRQLLFLHPDAIRLLRSKEPSFDLMTPETFSRGGSIWYCWRATTKKPSESSD